MNPIFLTETYKNIYSLPIGMKAINHRLNVGPVTITIKNHNKFYNGTLNVNGVISGLSQMFHEFNLESGMGFTYKNHEMNAIQLAFERDMTSSDSGYLFTDSPSAKLTWHHHEIASSDNCHRWQPIDGLDVCYAFGLLHDKTEYSYCRSFSEADLEAMAYFKKIPTASRKPDAILHHQPSNRYLIAKFESHSSDYKKHGSSNDVDVLVVWIDDEKDRSCLPKHVVALYPLAKQAACPH